MEKLTGPFKESVFDDKLSDVFLEMAELGIDGLVDNDIIKAIPFVNCLIGVWKTGQNLYDRNLLKQSVTFINEFNSGNGLSEKMEKHKKKLTENPKMLEDELGRILIILNQIIDEEKSRILAIFYRAYINERIDWQQFREYSEIVRQLIYIDIELLRKIYQEEIKDTCCLPSYQVQRLNSLGLINMTIKTIWSFDTESDFHISLSSLGSIFCEIIAYN